MVKITGWTKKRTGIKILTIWDSDKTKIGLLHNSKKGNDAILSIFNKSTQKRIINKRFKTKKEAITYITSYMRSHPKG